MLNSCKLNARKQIHVDYTALVMWHMVKKDSYFDEKQVRKK